MPTYPVGVPCWVDLTTPDPRAAAEFYGALLGWELSEPGPMPAGMPGAYVIASRNGHTVAGIGTAEVPSWNTYVRVDSAAQTAARALTAGGRVLLEATDGLAVIADPTGAALALREDGGAQLVNEPGSWIMSTLHTAEPSAASAFYAAVFGWQTEPFGGATLFRMPGYEGGHAQQAIPRDGIAVLAPPTPAELVPPHWNVNFRVDDADAVAAEAERLGGRVIAPPVDAMGVRAGVIGDPTGAVFSTSQVTEGARASRL
jgi:predicted enzyme related to lactoylglutathione lyase